MRSNKAQAFSYTEFLISVAILAIISMMSVYSLNSSRSQEELKTAQRVVAADLRTLQAKALNAENVKFCTNSSGAKIVCETSTTGCTDSCTAVPPAGVGGHFVRNAATYDFYAKYDPSTTDWRKSAATEVFQTRDLAKSGAANVLIAGFSVGVTADIAFERQNGGMKINVCPSGCTNDSVLTITLRHTKTGATKTVTLYTLTGRIVMD